MKIVDIDLIIAKRSAELRGTYKIKLRDALIASSCEMYQCTLITEDGDPTKIHEIKVKSLEEF